MQYKYLSLRKYSLPSATIGLALKVLRSSSRLWASCSNSGLAAKTGDNSHGDSRDGGGKQVKTHSAALQLSDA
ncbi:hypothetical protein Enr13x_61700 [Stieleria neptunia]|uniref:Uncharacterized protein n=1 Tax=Stieleria neptunia TaxID=2527979 RepID=A0A518HZH9_9BACT|nr:hypothetical protein Enr13x_61700 [Stieleria neptunia]